MAVPAEVYDLDEANAQQLADFADCAAGNPVPLARHVACLDTESGEEFTFHLDEPDSGWYWQRELLDDWHSSSKHVTLKARQLGVTWLASLYALWHILFLPGVRVLVVSINEGEAKKVIRKIATMYASLPPGFTAHVEVVKPGRTPIAEASTEIELRHLMDGGKLSTVIGLPSTTKAGHGETAALVILDETARQDYARETWKAVLPTAAKSGRILAISTGNGISVVDEYGTVAGNFFHYLYANADAIQARSRFYGVFTHPERDDDWYEREAMALPTADRGEQYPRNEIEAFILTGTPYFDMESILWYRENAVREPVWRGAFREEGVEERVGARRVEDQFGFLSVLKPPVEEGKYAISADVATGKGQDYSAAHVIDLRNREICAELRGKLAEDEYATQLHYLGRWYNNAQIAIENQGGWGRAVIIPLRDGKTGRPAYPKLYRHTQFDRASLDQHANWGYPMNTANRPTALNQLAAAFRERTLPWVTSQLLLECSTFVHRQTNPSPRAQDGCNDDLVMSAAIALEMFRQFGEHPKQYRPKRRPKRVRQYPWEKVRP